MTYSLTLARRAAVLERRPRQGERLQDDDRAGLQARLGRRRVLPQHRRRGGATRRSRPSAGSAASTSTTRPARSSSTSSSRRPTSRTSSPRSSRRPCPPTRRATDTSLHPLPATGPYVIKSYQPKSGIVEERNPNFQAWRFHDSRAGGQPRPRHLGHRPGRLGRAPPRPDRQGRLDELLPGSRASGCLGSSRSTRASSASSRRRTSCTSS